MEDDTLKPYLVRAIHEWCCAQGFTPYLVVAVGADTRVPMEYVKDGQIVLNIAPGATRDLYLHNDWITFSARFNGVARQIEVPVAAVAGVYARENGQGLFFPTREDDGEAGVAPPPDGETTPPKGRPSLKVVK